MKAFALAPVAFTLFFTACEKQTDFVSVEETRGATSKDTDPKLFATSDERFRDTKPSPVKGVSPEKWLKLPASQMRVLNYRFGESGLGEVYVSLSSGGVADNVNRWFKQFGKDPLSGADLAALEKVGIAGVEGVWIEAAGLYDPGMGRGAQPGYGLAGVIAEVDGQILTIKMIGPEAEVEAEKAKLRDFAATLELAGN